MAIEYKNTLAVLNRFANEWIALYKNKLADAGYSQGKLYNTINLDSISITADKAIITINLEEYWYYIENGRLSYEEKYHEKWPPSIWPPRNRPPINAIEKWIIKRNIIPRPIALKSGKTVIPTTTSLAFAMANSIAKKGIKARPFFKESLEEIKTRFIKEIENALVKDITSDILKPS